jgi:ubiquinone/menaquinone biosynthesis C-methylase UbiE
MTTPNNDHDSGQTTKLWDRFAEGYAKKPIADEQAYQKKLQVTQQYLKPDMNVLEIACGTGSTSILHAPHVQHILATDISSKMIAIAQQRAADAQVTNVDFEQASIEQLEIAAGSKDVVLGLSILHLLRNKQDVMQEVHTWLKPGGLFVTSTVCMADMDLATRIFAKTLLPIGQLFGVLPNVYSFSQEELKNSMQDSGFSIEYEWQPKRGAAFIIGKKTS